MLIQPYYQSALPTLPPTVGHLTLGQKTVGEVPFYESAGFQFSALGFGFALAVIGKLIKWFAYESLGKTISIAGVVIFGGGLAAFLIWTLIIPGVNMITQ